MSKFDLSLIILYSIIAGYVLCLGTEYVAQYLEGQIKIAETVRFM